MEIRCSAAASTRERRAHHLLGLARAAECGEDPAGDQQQPERGRADNTVAVRVSSLTDWPARARTVTTVSATATANIVIATARRRAVRAYQVATRVGPITVPGPVSHTSIAEPARNSAIGGHHEALASSQRVPPATSAMHKHAAAPTTKAKRGGHRRRPC